MSDAPKAASTSGSGGSKGPLLFVLLNTLVVLLGFATVFYTRVAYKKPQITEGKERRKIEELKAKIKLAPPPVPGLVAFEPLTINIRPVSRNPAAAVHPDAFHYATLGFSFELRDISEKDVIDTLKPVILDGILDLAGRKTYTDLTSVQGRYVLRAQILDMANRLAMKELKTQDAVVLNVFFTQFVVQ